jgi:hypothetical protein
VSATPGWWILAFALVGLCVLVIGWGVKQIWTWK